MVFKLLHELSASELRTELKRVGIKGKFVKAQAIVRLSTHLMDVSEDPVTFQFDPEVPIVEEAGVDNEYEVIGDPDVVTTTASAGGSAAGSSAGTVNSNAGGAAASVSGLVNSISGGTTPVTAPPTTGPTAFVPSTTTSSTTTTTASLTTSTVTTSSIAGSHYQNIGMGHYPQASGVQFYNPYNPNLPLYPGMPMPGQYPPTSYGMPYNPWPQGMPGMPAGSYAPWGGWPSAQPCPASPAAPAPAVQPGSSSGTLSSLNSVMADFTGACPPPARNSETKSTKILSGQYDTARREVKERQNWPQVMIDHVLNPETVDYDDMDWAGLTAGMTGKILAEMNPGMMDAATVNKIKHLNRLSNYGMKTPMRSILNFNAVLFRAVENKSLTWDNWDKIEQFHTRHLSSLTVAAATAGAGKASGGHGGVGGAGGASGGQGGQGGRKDKPSWNALRESMTKHSICFKFNSGKCDQEDDHDLNGDGRVLLHACGTCTHANRGVVKNHGSKECKPDFWPAPFRAQHRATGGGAVQ